MLEKIVSFMINHPFQCAAYSGLAGLIIYNSKKCPYKLLLGTNSQETLTNSQETLTSSEETLTSSEETVIKLPLPTRVYEQVKHKYNCVILKTQPFREKIHNYYSNIIHYNTPLLQPIIVCVVTTGLVYTYRGNLMFVPNNLAALFKLVIAKSRNNHIRDKFYNLRII